MYIVYYVKELKKNMVYICKIVRRLHVNVASIVDKVFCHILTLRCKKVELNCILVVLEAFVTVIVVFWSVTL